MSLQEVEDIQFIEDNSNNIQIKIEEVPRPILKKVEKKTISYEDILSSLNMKVMDGKLQYIDKNAKPLTQVSNNREPIPLTREEYQRLVLENKKKRIESLRRVQQIKSTKMMFSNNNMHGISVSSSPANLNRLFNFNR
jgi:hypothetical protein